MDDLHRLLETKVVREIDPGEVAGPLDIFTITEEFKKRRRCIKVPIFINSYLGRETIEEDMQIANKRDVLRLVADSQLAFVAQTDGKSFYDQIELHPAIGARMCFKKGDKCYAQCVATMGGRQSVQGAHAQMRQLANIPGGGTKRLVCIDNILLAGRTEEQVMDDLLSLRDRAKACNLTLNEAEKLEKDPASCITTTMEWGGVAFDLSTRETWLTDKIVKKIKDVWEQRSRWSIRGLATFLGLLFWSLGIIEVPMVDYFALLQFISRRSQEMVYASPEDWDKPANVWPSAMSDLQAWTDLCITNKRRRVPVASSSRTTWHVATDASKWGWGYVAVNQATGEVRTHGERWKGRFREMNWKFLRRSTFTEPHGVTNSLCHLLKSTDGTNQHVVVGTDNTVTSHSFNRGYNSHSYAINECIKKIQRNYSNLFTFEYRYIPGGINVYADAASRGKSINASEREIRERQSLVFGSENEQQTEGVPAPKTLSNSADMGAVVAQVDPSAAA